MATAFLRVLHLVAEEAPYVFEDRAAAQFLPAYQQRFLERLHALPCGWLQRSGSAAARSVECARRLWCAPATPKTH